jgi:hypothetical protein
MSRRIKMVNMERTSILMRSLKTLRVKRKIWRFTWAN